MNASRTAIDALKREEGFRPRMYLDQGGRPTIGYGTLIDQGHEQNLLTRTITEAEGEELLRRDVATFEQAIRDTIRVPLTQNQFDALVLFIYNVGPSAFRNGSLPRLINLKSPAHTISDKWREYRLVSGRVSAGLVKRRSNELQLFWRHLWAISLVLFTLAALAIVGGTYALVG